MGKIRAFTLLEMIIVITIIAFVSLSLSNMIKSTGQGVDIGREATNIIYKGIDQHVKDYERKKVWEDASGNAHEIDYLRILIGTTGDQLIIGNYYSGDDYNYFDSGALIRGGKYAASQYLKGVNGYNFRVRNKSGNNTNDIESVWISDIGKIYTGDTNIDNTGGLDGAKFEFLICGGSSGSLIPIGAITINAATKTTKLDRCESNRYAGIDCVENFKNCNGS